MANLLGITSSSKGPLNASSLEGLLGRHCVPTTSIMLNQQSPRSGQDSFHHTAVLTCVQALRFFVHLQAWQA